MISSEEISIAKLKTTNEVQTLSVEEIPKKIIKKGLRIEINRLTTQRLFSFRDSTRFC